MLLWELLGDRKNGFFVEAGAYDGYTFSVSYLFECAGWNGLLVEPLADRAAECADRRKASRVVVAALSRPGERETAHFKRVPWFEMYSGFEPPDPLRGFPNADLGTIVAETTPILTLDAVLGDHSGPIDFVVLDVEGHELAALEGFDLDRWRPSVLLIEDAGSGRDRPVRSTVSARGYDYVASLAHNDLFIRHDEIRLARRLRRYWFHPGPLTRR